MNTDNKLIVSILSVFGIETISYVQAESIVKILCQILLTTVTVYYLIKKHKTNEKSI